MTVDCADLAQKLRELGEHAHAGLIETLADKIEKGVRPDRTDRDALDTAAKSVRAVHGDAAQAVVLDMYTLLAELLMNS
jgi:Cdc6-like AAA superfamily ATPase